MKAFLEARILSVEPADFKDAKTGKTVKYSSVYIRDEDGSVSKLGTTIDIGEKLIDVDSVMELKIKPAFDKPNQFRITIAAVK